VRYARQQTPNRLATPSQVWFCTAPAEEPFASNSIRKAAGAGFAGSLTRLSLADRDLFFRRLPCRGSDRGPTPGRSHPAEFGCDLRGFVSET
jgi:hypothetical protein